MDPAKIEAALRLGEDSKTEFKSVARSGFQLDARDLAKAVVAFANSGGGRILVGVDDDGTPSGVGTVEQADALMLQVVQVCRDRVHPPIRCDHVKVEVRGVPLLLVDVPGFTPDRPYRVDHVYYVRDANQSREARPDELKRLLQSGSIHYDEQPIGSATIDDIDMTAVRDFLAPRYAVEATSRDLSPYLVGLRCLDATGAPTLAGLLLFGKAPERWLLDAKVSAARIRGTGASGEYLDLREVTGRLLTQVERTVAFVAAHAPSPAPVEGTARVEEGLPMRAVREAVVNALTHRDYRVASQIRVFVFDDRVEVVNPGALLNQLTLDGIKLGGISQRRNPVIASVLAWELRRENLGMGVPRMIELMKERGLPEPEFRVEAGHFRVILRVKPAAATP